MNEPRNRAWLVDDIGAAMTGARYYPESPSRDRILDLLVEARSIAWRESVKTRSPTVSDRKAAR